jgi:glycosyltransferase involved in cell wall biosynthesis
MTGVGRVIEELLRYLRVNPQLDLQVTGGFGGDWNPLITSLSVQKWASTFLTPPIKALKGYRQRSQIGGRLAETLYRLQERANRAAENSSPMVQKCQTVGLAAIRRLAQSAVEWGAGRNEVDVFHSTFRSPPDWLSPAVPRVITIHDVIPLRYRNDYDPITLGTLETVLASLDPKRDFATAVSQYTKNDFCDLSGFPPERVVVAPLSAADHFRPVTAENAIAEVRERYGLADKPFLLSVSNPQPRKNIPLLIRSFYTVLRKLPSWDGNLVLVGNVTAGFGVNAIRYEIAKEPELSHRVIWAGGVSDEHLCYLYSSCRAFLFPSTLEGFGLPALEAMKCGAPVICSNTSSLPEVAGDAAIMIDPRDEMALANAIFDVVSNPARQRELAAQSLRRAASFSWKASAEKVAEAYELAVNAGHLQSAR